MEQVLSYTAELKLETSPNPKTESTKPKDEVIYLEESKQTEGINKIQI